MKIFSNEVKIALVAIVGIVVLFFGLNFLKGLKLFSNDNTYYIAFDDISGLSTSSPIYSGGYQVGVVTGVDYDYTHKEPTRVAVNINHGMHIPEGTTAEIASDLLGNVQVNLVLPETSTGELKPGDVIPGATTSGVMGKISAMLPAVEQMLPKLDSIMGSLNALFADPSISRSLHNVEHITGDLTTSTRDLNKLLDGLNKQVPGLMTKADGVLDNANKLTDNLANVDVQATMSEVEQTVARLKALTDKLSSDKGTLGLLMNNPDLYNQLTTTVRSADELVKDIKAHPKRYINVSVFGRKEKSE